MNALKHSLMLSVSFAFVFVWQNTILSSYTIPALGFLIFIYMMLSIRSKKAIYLDNGGNKSVLVLNTAILLFIFTTQGIHSPLFFLLYFVLFGIAFVFEPLLVFVYVLLTTALFFNQTLQGDFWGNIPSIASLYLIAPLAFYFGREYKQRTATEQQTAEAAQRIEKDVEEVLETENLSPKSTEKLKDAEKEAEKLTQ